RLGDPPQPAAQPLPLVSLTIRMASPQSSQPGPVLMVDKVDFHYGEAQALKGVSLEIEEKKVTAFIGPSGCGKSTLLRCLNRMNDLIDGARVTSGRITIGGVDIHDKDVDVIELRKRVGMVFQKSNPFPKT